MCYLLFDLPLLDSRVVVTERLASKTFTQERFSLVIVTDRWETSREASGSQRSSVSIATQWRCFLIHNPNTVPISRFLTLLSINPLAAILESCAHALIIYFQNEGGLAPSKNNNYGSGSVGARERVERKRVNQIKTKNEIKNIPNVTNKAMGHC